MIYGVEFEDDKNLVSFFRHLSWSKYQNFDCARGWLELWIYVVVEHWQQNLLSKSHVRQNFRKKKIQTTLAEILFWTAYLFFQNS